MPQLEEESIKFSAHIKGNIKDYVQPNTARNVQRRANVESMSKNSTSTRDSMAKAARVIAQTVSPFGEGIN